MEDKKEQRWGWNEAGEPCMWYCEKCDCAWWYDEMNQLHGSKIPSIHRDAVIQDVEHKICPVCEKKQLFDLFEKYGTEHPHRVDNKKVFYHLTRSDVPLAEKLDDDDSEYMISMGVCETSAMRDWKQQHFEVRFDFEDNKNNGFYDQSMWYKKEIYRFMLSQLKSFGVDAEIKTMAD